MHCCCALSTENAIVKFKIKPFSIFSVGLHALYWGLAASPEAGEGLIYGKGISRPPMH